MRNNVISSKAFCFYRLRLASLFALLLLVTGCSLFGNKRPAYQSAEYYKNLEVPPNLTRPARTDELKVPVPTKQALQHFKNSNELAANNQPAVSKNKSGVTSDIVILPEFKGVRVVNSAGSSWLEVNANVEKVWPELVKFWQHEGIGIARKRPLLGFIETKWVVRSSAGESYIQSLFQDYGPDQKDKFRLRVERFDNGNKTRIFITHSGIERVMKGDGSDGFIWVFLPVNVEQEREIIDRLALYVGLTPKQRLQLVKDYHPYASLVTLDPNNSIALTMKGNLAFVQHRALRALDRLLFDNIKEEGANVIHFTVNKLSNQTLNIKEDKLSKTSWIMQLFSSDKKSGVADKNHQFKLLLTAQKEKGDVRIEVLGANGNTQKDEDGDVSGSALAEQIRDLLAKKLE